MFLYIRLYYFIFLSETKRYNVTVYKMILYASLWRIQRSFLKQPYPLQCSPQTLFVFIVRVTGGKSVTTLNLCRLFFSYRSFQYRCLQTVRFWETIFLLKPNGKCFVNIHEISPVSYNSKSFEAFTYYFGGGGGFHFIIVTGQMILSINCIYFECYYDASVHGHTLQSCAL